MLSRLDLSVKSVPEGSVKSVSCFAFVLLLNTPDSISLRDCRERARPG
jgi:hypothetical protein